MPGLLRPALAQPHAQPHARPDAGRDSVVHVKIALLQIDPTVGDLEGNAGLLAEAVGEAARAGVELAVASELCLLGYPPRDLLLSHAFVARSWEVCAELARELRGGPALLVGLAEANEGSAGRPLYNAAALLYGGAITQVFRKTLLPTYDVFDEDRYFEPADGPQLMDWHDLRLGISVCEDVWNDHDFWQRRRYHSDPVEGLVAAGAAGIVNMSASPFAIGKQPHREAMLSAIARRHGVPVLYVNQVGGADELVFDGRSGAFAADGSLVARAAAFAPDVLVVDTGDLDAAEGGRAVVGSAAPGGGAPESDSGASAIHPPALAADDFTPASEIWRALVLGVRDYVAKSGFERALVGLSGGIDSAVVAAVATEALGPDNVLCVLMPSPYSSAGSVTDAEALAASLGVRTTTLPIEPIMASFDASLTPVFKGRTADVTEENVQARIRGNLLMALSNKFSSLLLTTGNKSELAVGYCTIYGDMSGGLAVISDVPKTLVYEVARWLNQTHGREVVPRAIIDKAPSAELRPDQTDQDSLPPYDELDGILKLLVEEHRGADEIVAAGYERATVERVARLVTANEFKRKQAAPGLKVTDLAFGMGWRMPIATVPRSRRRT
jgi:NAD+ synthase/NAD+ synthase (glutamine-hydrolysing)